MIFRKIKKNKSQTETMKKEAIRLVTNRAFFPWKKQTRN